MAAELSSQRPAKIRTGLEVRRVRMAAELSSQRPAKIRTGLEVRRVRMGQS
jgi:hypothetical protein